MTKQKSSSKDVGSALQKGWYVRPGPELCIVREVVPDTDTKVPMAIYSLLGNSDLPPDALQVRRADKLKAFLDKGGYRPFSEVQVSSPSLSKGLKPGSAIDKKA